MLVMHLFQDMSPCDELCNTPDEMYFTLIFLNTYPNVHVETYFYASLYESIFVT